MSRRCGDAASAGWDQEAPQGPLCLLLRVSLAEVEPRPHRLTRLEVDVRSGRDDHLFAGPRVPRPAALPVADAECAEVPQLDAVALRQRSGDPVEDGSDHRIHLLREEVRVLLYDASDKLGSDHEPRCRPVHRTATTSLPSR